MGEEIDSVTECPPTSKKRAGPESSMIKFYQKFKVIFLKLLKIAWRPNEDTHKKWKRQDGIIDKHRLKKSPNQTLTNQV